MVSCKNSGLVLIPNLSLSTIQFEATYEANLKRTITASVALGSSNLCFATLEVMSMLTFLTLAGRRWIAGFIR